jgi:hypothetical protein
MRRSWIIEKRTRENESRQPELQPALQLPLSAPREDFEPAVDEEKKTERGIAVISFYI